MFILKMGHVEKVSRDRIPLTHWVDDNMDGNFSFNFTDYKITIYCKNREVGTITEIEEIT